MIEDEKVYRGTGNFHLISDKGETPTFDSSFTLTIPTTDRPKIEIPSIDFIIAKKIFEDIRSPHFTLFSMRGRLENGFYISIDEMGANTPRKFSIFSPIRTWQEGANPETVQAHYGLTNFAFMGCYYFAQDNDRPRLDAFNVTIEGVPIEIRKNTDYDLIVERLKKERISHVTSEAICTIPFKARDEWIVHLDQLSWLISLAACEEIVVLYADYYDGKELIASDLYPQIRTPFAGRSPTIPIDRLPCCIKKFLEAAFPVINKYQDEIKLKTLIHLAVTSQHPFLTLEEKFLIGIMALESFCSDTIKILKKNKRQLSLRSVDISQEKIKKVLDENHIHLDDQIIKEIASRTASNHPDFRDKLRYALEEFSVIFSESDLALIPDRNEIVHNGQFKRASDPVERYHELSNLLIRILLTILNYRGEYINRGPNYPLKELPRKEVDQ